MGSGPGKFGMLRFANSACRMHQCECSISQVLLITHTDRGPVLEWAGIGSGFDR